jgi:hypothetical protein
MPRQNSHDGQPVIRTSDAQPGDIMILLTYPRSSSEGKRARLEITDEMSRETLLSVELAPEQLMDMMSSTGVRVSGAQLPHSVERIGKRSQTTSTVIGRRDELSPEQVRDAYLAAGWETVDIRKTNYGHHVVARRWVRDDPKPEPRTPRGRWAAGLPPTPAPEVDRSLNEAAADFRAQRDGEEG